MRRIAIQNLKGGTAKTTTAVNLAHGLARLGRRVLLLDADVQGNVSACLGLRPECGLYQLLIEDATIGQCTVPSGRDGLDILPADRTLALAEVQLQTLPRREEMLSLRMRPLVGYDYVIVDCGPTLSLLHQNVLLFADELLIPISTEYLAMLGAQQIVESMKFLRRYFDRSPLLLGVLPTLFDRRTALANEISKAIGETYSAVCPVLDHIPMDTKVGQSMAKRLTIFEHAEASRAALAYRGLATWVDQQTRTHELRTEGAAHA